MLKRQSIRMALAMFTHHSAQRQKTATAGRWVRDAPHGEVPEQPTLPKPGTRYCDLSDEDSVPELGGSRPDLFLDVSGPQERVQRHPVEQSIVTLAPVQVLDASVPPSVDQLVLKIVDMNLKSGEKVIDVPKIIFQDPIPQRAVLRAPQLVRL